MARSLGNGHWLARTSRPAEVVDAEPPVAEERDPIDETAQARAMRQAMAQLSPDHRAVLAQVYYRGMSIVDAADTLGIPAGTVTSRSYHALRALRLVLDELGVSLEAT